MHDWLHLPLVFLAAAVVVVPLARWLRLGAILGYLVAGVVIGPPLLGVIESPETVLQFAEFGVVLMMFLVGLELEPRRLWAMRRPIFGWGSVQLFGSTALLMLPALALGWSWQLALVASLGLAMSSTAVAMAVLAERNLARTTAGESVVSVSLLQDIAAIPIIGLVPVIAMGAPARGLHGLGGWQQAVEALRVLAIMAGFVFGGRLLLRPALRWIARSGIPEIFTAAALLLVIGTAAFMEMLGLSAALGAFLAGVLLAESEYRHELETDLEPFRGLLMGLFFIAVGMGLDLHVFVRKPLLVMALLGALLTVKGCLLALMARWMKIARRERPVFVILLAQGGEFGFVVFQLAAQSGLLRVQLQSALVAAVAISLALTPGLLAWAESRVARKRKRRGGAGAPMLQQEQDSPVILAGFGRYGQIIGRMLHANGIEPTVLDHDAEAIASLQRFGWRVHYGDATRLDLLRTAGAARARVLVVAVDDIAQSMTIVELARAHFPQLAIVARARNVSHYYRLRDAGVTLIERETFDSALMSGRSVLEQLGMERHAARKLAWRFRRHSIEQLETMMPLRANTDALLAAATAGRQQFEQLMAQERAHAQARRRGDDEDDDENPAAGNP